MRRDFVPRAVMRRVVRAGVRPTLDSRLPVTAQRRILDAIGRVAVLPAATMVTTTSLAGRRADRIEQPAAAADRAVLYLHGGGYTVGSLVTHRPIAAHLAASVGAPVYLLDYRLAPEHPAPAGVEDTLAAFRSLVERGLLPADRIVLAGDSAGAGLALAVALRLRDEGADLPGALGLISPFADATLENVPDHDDPLLSRRWLARCAEMYAGADPRSQDASPALADLHGLPPVVLQASSDEILLADVRRLADRLRAAGNQVAYEELADCWHVIHLHAGLVPESTEAVTSLGRALAALLG